MQVVPILFGVACAGAVALAPLSPKRDRRDCTFLAVVLLAAWAASNIAWLTNSIDDLVVMDGAVLALSIVLIQANPNGWRMWFFGMSLAQMGLHALRCWYGTQYIVPFFIAYDLTFAGEIVAIAWGGGTNAFLVARSRLRRMGRFSSPRSGQAG